MIPNYSFNFIDWRRILLPNYIIASVLAMLNFGWLVINFFRIPQNPSRTAHLPGTTQQPSKFDWLMSAPLGVCWLTIVQSVCVFCLTPLCKISSISHTGYSKSRISVYLSLCLVSLTAVTHFSCCVIKGNLHNRQLVQTLLNRYSKTPQRTA